MFVERGVKETLRGLNRCQLGVGRIGPCMGEMFGVLACCSYVVLFAADAIPLHGMLLVLFLFSFCCFWAVF